MYTNIKTLHQIKQLCYSFCKLYFAFLWQNHTKKTSQNIVETSHLFVIVVQIPGDFTAEFKKKRLILCVCRCLAIFIAPHLSEVNLCDRKWSRTNILPLWETPTLQSDTRFYWTNKSRKIVPSIIVLCHIMKNLKGFMGNIVTKRNPGTFFQQDHRSDLWPGHRAFIIPVFSLSFLFPSTATSGLLFPSTIVSEKTHP